MVNLVATYSNTSQSGLLLTAVNSSQQRINSLGAQQLQQQKFASSADMTQAQNSEYFNAQNTLIRTTQLSDQAQTFYNKVSAAQNIVNSIQTKIIGLNTYVNGNTITPQSATVALAEINSTLQFMQSQLNTSDPTAGGYIFASSSDNSVQPISDIVNSVNYSGPDNIPNSSYVVNPAQTEMITLANGAPQVNASIDPGDPAFMNVIAALHQVKAVLTQNPLPNTIPLDVLNLFSSAKTDIGNFLATNLAPLVAIAQASQDLNNNVIDNITQTIENDFSIDPIDINSQIADQETRIALLTSLILAQQRQWKPWEH